MTREWNDYKAYTLEELVSLQKLLTAIPEDERCNNFTPDSSCCHSCNYYKIVMELTERLRTPIST